MPQRCPCLQPLVDALAAHQITLKPTTSPYGDDMAWWACDCTFDEPALRERLQLPPTLVYTEYFGFAAGSDTTWTCRQHQTVLIGPHPKMAGPDTFKLS